MNTLRNFTKIIDRQTVIVIGLALLSTYLCHRYGLALDLPSEVIGIAIVFPLVFSINSAYRRREEALQSFANIKANAIALYFAHRDWVPNGATESQKRGAELIQRLFDGIADCFSGDKSAISGSIQKVYGICSDLSRSHELMRAAGVPANEVSGANTALRTILYEVERMANISNYRTPVALRAYNRLFINLFPIIFGPYFASVAVDYPIITYVFTAFYAFVLVSLDNIQEHLENPYDGMGADDLQVRVSEEYKRLLTL